MAIRLCALTYENLPHYAAGITDIYKNAVCDSVATVEMIPPTVEQMSDRVAQKLSEGYPAFVALGANDNVLGYVYGSKFRSAEAFRPTVEHSVYVHENARGLGVGRRLMDVFVKEAEARDFRQIIAVIESRQSASIAFHKALDFVEVGRLNSLAFKDDKWCTAVFMQRSLGAGDDTAPLHVAGE